MLYAGATLRRVHAGGVQLSLDPSARAGLLAAQAKVRHIVASGDVVYGINTGFGKLADVRIPPTELNRLQLNLVRFANAVARELGIDAWQLGENPELPGGQVIVERQMGAPGLVDNQGLALVVADLGDPFDVRACAIRGRADDERAGRVRMPFPDLCHLLR